MDFHELTDDMNKAEEDIDNKKLKDQWDYTRGLRQQYLSEYIDFGNTTLVNAYLTRIGLRTPERLESWRSECRSVFEEVLGSEDVRDLWESSVSPPVVSVSRPLSRLCAAVCGQVAPRRFRPLGRR